MISFQSRGSFKNLEAFLMKSKRSDIYSKLDEYGRMGVAVLSSATPVDSGETAAAWYYRINRSSGSYSISWCNSHVVNGVSVVILLHYGHGTGTGGYVQGRDFINPAIRPAMDKIANEVWKVVSSA